MIYLLRHRVVVWCGGWRLASVIELPEKYLGLITKYVNYSTTKTTLNMIQVFKDEKDKYFLDYPNTSTKLSFILTQARGRGRDAISNTKSFWWLALNIKCWIRNRIFVSIFTMKILMELWIFYQEMWIFIIYSCEMSSPWHPEWRLGAVGLLSTLFISTDISTTRYISFALGVD